MSKKTLQAAGAEPEEEQTGKNKPTKEEKDAKKKAHIQEKNRLAMMEQLRSLTGLNENDLYYSGEKNEEIEVISTGHEEVDSVLTPDIYEKTGKGGVPRGFICELYGPVQGGKSSLALMLAGSVTREKNVVMWADVEGSLYPDWAERHGVDRKYLATISPAAGRYGEWYLDHIEKGIGKGIVKLLVIDSVAALLPKVMMEADIEDDKVAALARMMSKAMPRFVGIAKQGNCAIVLINQVRSKAGRAAMFGNPETTPGGGAIGFFSSIRVRLQRPGKNDRGIYLHGEEIGMRSHIQTVKNRFGRCFMESILPIYYGSQKPTMMDQLLDMALVKKVVSSKTSKDELNPKQYFTLKGFPKLTNVDGFDAFRKDLDVDALREIGRRLKEKKGAHLTPELEKYVLEPFIEEDEDAPPA